MLRLANTDDAEKIYSLYRSVCEAMNSEGLNQWEWGRYPTVQRLNEDLRMQRMYVYEENNELFAAVVLEDVQEAEYIPLNWLFGVHPGVFHRFAVSPTAQGKGLGRKLFPEMEQILRNMGCDSVRFDTEHDNRRAISMYDKIAARRVGIIHWDGDETDYIAFEKPLTSDCPMLPLRMVPAFRSGKLTPWGGEKLRTVYGKNIHEVPTGESLEVSCIPGLESTDVMGVKLPEIISRFGEKFAGKYAAKPFPLLLKIIDADDSLSVQVHPDDAYAAANENGKLGKTEAWLILDAPEGSQLVYGIKPGTNAQELRNACENGSQVEELLRRVDVKPGDVCFIPAGCVHAIGKGIMLYEIQQSSDVTYRFYDWDRRDKNGNKRELHINKAIDVTDVSFSLSPVSSGTAKREKVLDEKYFSLDIFNVSDDSEIGEISEFGFLTALTDGLTIAWQGGNMTMTNGETLYIPTSSTKLYLEGSGKAALAMPK